MVAHLQHCHINHFHKRNHCITYLNNAHSFIGNNDIATISITMPVAHTLNYEKR
jgi:hypothetical protein